MFADQRPADEIDLDNRGKGKGIVFVHSGTNEGKHRGSSVLFLMLCFASFLIDDDHYVHASLASLKGFAFALSYGDLNTGALRCDC